MLQYILYLEIYARVWKLTSSENIKEKVSKLKFIKKFDHMEFFNNENKIIMIWDDIVYNTMFNVS